MEGVLDYWLTELRNHPDPMFQYSSDFQDTALIIDNGSYKCRVGWATDAAPRMSFRNCYARQRKDRAKKNLNTVPEMELLAGNDISNIESVRFLLKSPHDENIVTHFEGQELMFDYAFNHLGINTEMVDHPVIITEAFANPTYSRQCMSELLFECYNIPKVSYCIDGLLSYYYNANTYNEFDSQNGVVINIGNFTTLIMPILDGVVSRLNSRRIRIGGQHLTRYLWRWLQLRFPHHINGITMSRAEVLIAHSQIAGVYSEAIAKWSDANYYEKNVKKIQFPYYAQTTPSTTAASADQLKDRKREAAKRLIDINARRRGEKLEEEQLEMSRLMELKDAMHEFTPEEVEYQHALEEAQVQTMEELTRKIQNINQRIQKIKLKMEQLSQIVVKTEEVEEAKVPKNVLEAPSDKEQMSHWIDGLKMQWRDIQARKTARRNRRSEMAKRRTAASQQRMRIISHLAKKDKKEDNFGMRDEDWDVYKTINKDGGGSDSEDDDEKLQEVETALRHYNPEFFGDGGNKTLTLQEKYQLTLSTEMIRVGEILFQPSMCGVEQGGISAALDYVLKLHSADQQDKLVQNIFVTGGSSQIRGLKERLEIDLMANRPFKSTFKVNMTKNPELDPWLGARLMSPEILSSAITKNDYLECGPGYLGAHRMGNGYWRPKPVLIPEIATPEELIL